MLTVLGAVSFQAAAQQAPNQNNVPASVSVPAALPDAPASTVAPLDLAAATATAVAAASPTMRDRATLAATATLTALLPRLAVSDSVPMLDRSAALAGDLSKLLNQYTANAARPANANAEVGKVRSLLESAVALIGTPYRWGGTSTEGFDCSGLVSYVFRNAVGIELPRVSREMAADNEAKLISSTSELRQGDLVFFGHRGRVDHVGIYVGEGRFLHSPSTGKDVRVDTLLSGYWSNKFMQARRVAM
jgi:cell wall-associated NlpC family hydrolase